MIDLDKYSSLIEEFVQSSIEKFRDEDNIEPRSIGVYCCPWAGWLTINFNVTRTLEETGNNCPDFEFVEFDMLELEGWQEEYESENPTYKTNDSILNKERYAGDEILNEVVFKYLDPIVSRLKSNNRSEFLLQMLDSSYVKVF